MFKATFLGHQGWLFRTSTTTVLLDPLLTERFGPFVFQIATTASDANRFAIRVARAGTALSTTKAGASP